MYCKAGQSTEEEMYNNEHSSPAFTEFLDLIGRKVKLKGFDKFKGGLDNKSKLIVSCLPMVDITCESINLSGISNF